MSMTLEQAMTRAAEYHRSGRPAEAEAVCRQVLTASPRHAPALHLLGILSGEAGRPDIAVELIGRAIAASPGAAVYHQDLGESYRRLGQMDKAIASLRRAVELNPGLALAHKNLGRCLEAQGRLDDAINAFRRAMKLARADPEIHNLLGAALSRQGKRVEAIAAYRCAIKLNPDYAEAYTNLGNTLASKGQTDEALAAHQRAVALRPEGAVFHQNLASALKLAGRHEEAVAAYRHALALDPGLSAGHNNLGLTLAEMGRYAEAIAAYRRARELAPDSVDVGYNLALALLQTGQTEEAGALLRHTIARNPGSGSGSVAAYNLLGVLLLQSNAYDEAIAILSQAIAIDPQHAGPRMNLGLALSEQGRLDEAVAALRSVLALDPKSSEAYGNLGKLLRDQGAIDDALAHFRQAIALRPDNATAAANLIQTLHYHPDYDAQALLAEARRWAERFAAPLAAEILPHPNDRTADRRLRVGYVSPDYRQNHPIGQVLLPLFVHHDRRQVELFAYSDLAAPDRVTERYRAAADAWRDTSRLDDRTVAQQIRDDRIDILVDLALWSANNRLRVFARKPAPVQVTLLGMPSTSGLATMDYRLTDPYLDPPGTTDGDYSERSIRLPRCLWCYPPIEGTPPVGALPALTNGFVTFGCLNQSAKLSRPALELWTRILQAIPGSQLKLVLPPCQHRDAVRALFREGGIADDRLVFVPRVSHREYLQSFNDLDLFLDPFPYNGHTTTLDALWMGVPVITLAGPTAVGRGGVSLLSNIGLTELITTTPEQYAATAARWAGDLASLAALRAGLRERMEASPLTDAPRYAADVEAAFRRMWMDWCGA